jgi:poly(ADP-ribose) polymerase-like protein
MPHVFEPAASGRAKCRGCGRVIAKGEIRFGERIPNPFAEGEATLWFHPMCAAYKRPEAMLEALQQAREGATADGASVAAPDPDALEQAARGNAVQRRLQRIDGVERSPTGQAKCRQCHEPIGKGEWRLRLVFYEEGRFSPSGFVHVRCRGAYFETTEVLAPALHFSPDLPDGDRADLRRVLEETR